ncbi:MAG: ABC transporter ATP-binding protein [Chthonomonadaceae bacterium]
MRKAGSVERPEREASGILGCQTGAVVETQGLGKVFFDGKGNHVEAVKEVSLRVEPGQILGLLGVNGAGKTTLLRMLSTVLEPTSGTAAVAGYNVATDPEKVRASIGFMSASTALYGRLSPLELLKYFGQLYGLGGSTLRSRIDTLVEQLGIGEFADRLCDRLSTGQKQRVSIARTMLHEPPVLFFDEPTSGLDVLTSQTVLGFIERSRDEGKTVVFCSHIMSEVERLCDPIAIIHNGSIRGEGSLAEILDQTNASSLERAFLHLAESPEAVEVAS